MASRLLMASLLALAVSACGSSSSPPIGKTCLVNSDCNNPLSCTFGRCHEACHTSGDCPAGQTCVKGPVDMSTGQPANICQLPEDKTCAYNSDCAKPLRCARDLHCRNECQADVDCNVGQTCALGDKVCADPVDLMAGMLKNTIDGSVPELRPGADAGGGAGGVGGTSDGGASDSSAAGTGGGDAAPGVDVPSTPITVDVMADKTTVRQGGLVTLTITGPDVSNPTACDVGGFTAAVLPGGTMNMFKVTVAIPHGAALGAKDVKCTTASGVGMKAAVFTVSAITAGPMGDDNNEGTTDKPFKTFNKALTVAAAGDTVSLMDGKYNTMGEMWTKAVPDKVTIIGASTDNTVLEGPGAMGGYVSVDGLFFSGDATVKNLTVGYFNYNVHVKMPGTITLENVKSVGSRYDGLYIESGAMGAKVTVTGMGSDFSGNTQSSAQVANGMGVSLTFSNGAKVGSMTYYGLQVSGMMNNLVLDGVTMVSPATSSGLLVQGASNNVQIKKTTMDNTIQFQSNGPMYTGTLELTDSTMTLKPNTYGISFYGANLNLNGTSITGGSQQILQYSGAAKIRGSKFMNYTQRGIYIRTGSLDLGTGMDPGTNEFSGPDMAYVYGLYDERQLAMQSITCSFTTFNGLRPDPGKLTKMAGVNPDPTNVAGKYYISTVGNTIEFF